MIAIALAGVALFAVYRYKMHKRLGNDPSTQFTQAQRGEHFRDQALASARAQAPDQLAGVLSPDAADDPVFRRMIQQGSVSARASELEELRHSEQWHLARQSDVRPAMY